MMDSSPSTAVGRLSLAVVGLRFGRHVIDWIGQAPAKDFFSVKAVCDTQQERARQTAREIGVEGYDSLEVLLAESDCSAVCLFTPPQGRAKIIRRILEAGRHVLTTKPFEVDPVVAADILAEAHRRGLVVHLNSPGPQPSGPMGQIIRWRKDYDLGRPIAAHAQTWANYREEADGGWYDDAEKCSVSPILRLGIYPLNEMVQVLGYARRVQVQQSRLFTGRPTSDNAQLGIEFESGALGNVFASFCIGDGEYYKNAMTLHFERGTIYVNVGPGSNEESDTSMQLVAVQTDGGRVFEEAAIPSRSGDYQWEAFARAVRGEVLEDATTDEQIIEPLRILQAMGRADRTGQPAEVAR